METTKLERTDGFLLRDAPEATVSVGPTRLGAKLIAGNAVMYARTLTYAFAALEQPKAGMTIGLRSEPADAETAVAALADELADDFAAQRLLTSPGLRLTADTLAPVLAHDQRSDLRLTDRDGISFEDELVGLGAVVAAEAAAGGIDGRSVAVEGFGPAGVGVAREVEARGGSVVRIGTSKGTVSGSLDAAALAGAWAEHGDGMVTELGDAGKPWEIWRGDGVDVVFCGSKPGALSGEGAASLGSTAVVPIGPAPVSSKALADLRRVGTTVLPDFVSTLGPILSWWLDDGASADSVRGLVTDAVTGILAETSDHADGAVLGACYRAEAFMDTWMAERPFGRPLG